MADKDQPTEQELIEATRARRKKVSETKAQPGTDVSWTDEKQDEQQAEPSSPPASKSKK